MKIPSYADWQRSLHRTISNFPAGFAFSETQFEEQKKRLHVKDNSELVNIGGGGFIRKKDKSEFKKLNKYIEDKKKFFLKNPKFVYEMFKYEMDNYEYGLTMNKSEILMACEITWKELKENSMYYNCFLRAERDYLDSFG